MIFGNINYSKTNEALTEDIKRCFKYAKENDLIGFEKGTHEIDGENLFVNIVEYDTTVKEERFWEAHKKYLDVHLMLDGEEKIALNFIDNLKQNEYQEEGDFLPLDGEAVNSEVILRKGDFLVCYPEDAHMTALKVEEKSSIKKAIFKVIIR
ncbi:YhcH/YjgK/YiaL family protein [Peptacetobacter sp.]|uniref:YhcH/YjgK/YiaL family protein n=3 Tax=Peptacetobacter sp. TaxID=2991975 RepID=UPI002608AEA1|nr:YhcH/YjgK/YiaL family protein [Peptacetobacter sp.]